MDITYHTRILILRQGLKIQIKLYKLAQIFSFLSTFFVRCCFISSATIAVVAVVPLRFSLYLFNYYFYYYFFYYHMAATMTKSATTFNICIFNAYKHKTHAQQQRRNRKLLKRLYLCHAFSHFMKNLKKMCFFSIIFPSVLPFFLRYNCQTKR